MSEPNIFQPFCRHCSDFHFVRNARGAIVPCNRCSCPVCERLIDTHPDLGGCVCFSEPIGDSRQNGLALGTALVPLGARGRLIVNRSPVVALPLPRLSLAPGLTPGVKDDKSKGDQQE